MDASELYKTIPLIIIISLVITYIIIKYVYTPTGNIEDITKGPFNLSTKNLLMSTEQSKSLLFSSNEFTLSMFIKLDAHDKTARIGGQPINIVQRTGIWAFQYIPSNNPAYRFEIKRLGDISGFTNQIIDLPPLPERKWVYLSILREGRRIDILYNDVVVGSAYLNTFPVIADKPVEAGDPTLSGTIVLVNGASSRYGVDDIRHEREARSDTRGKPYITGESDFNIVIPTIGCPGGDCSTVAANINRNNKVWSSPYA